MVTKTPIKITRDQCYTDPVANLTIAIDDSVLRRARVRAVEQGTSVNAILRDFLVEYVDGENQMAVRQRIVERGRQLNASSGPEGRTWTRNDLYDRGA